MGLFILITLDTGAEGNLIRHDIAQKIGLAIFPASQRASQADGSSYLNVIGETSFTIERDGMKLL